MKSSRAIQTARSGTRHIVDATFEEVDMPPLLAALALLAIAFVCSSDSGIIVNDMDRFGSMSPWAQPISFANMQPGDRIVARVEFRGCFSHSVHALTFDADADGAALTRFTLFGNELIMPDARGVPMLEYVSPNRIDRAKLLELDAVLTYYRGERLPQSCTSSIIVDLSRYRFGNLLATEHYEDSSCPDVAGFFSLVQLRRTTPGA